MSDTEAVTRQAIVVRVQERRWSSPAGPFVELVEVEDRDGKSIRPDEIHTDEKTGEQVYVFFVEHRVKSAR